MGRVQGRQLAAVMFADMVGFTALMQVDERLAVEKRDAFRKALESLHQPNGGTIVQYYGDGALSVFSNSVDAVLCAAEIQHQLSNLEVDARVGLHVGNVIVEPTGLVGDAVNVASRIESFGVPGAVLVSDAVYDLVRNQSHLDFTSLGQFDLDNVDRPFEIFALAAEGLTVPSVDELDGKGRRITGDQAEDGPPTNLPYRITEFIGRATEIDAVRNLVGARRLVTLTGSGGIGKTSLAIRTATGLQAEFPDGVWLVEMASLTDQVQIPGAIASTIGIEVLPGQDITDALAEGLDGRRVLLILDNCEHLIEGAAKQVDALLRATRSVNVLATSRETLRVEGEATFRVPSLGYPSQEATGDQIAASEAVSLFMDRATLTQTSFRLEGNEQPVVDICRHLDGIPLAIELAAARLDTLTVAQIAQGLDDRFQLLARKSRSAAPRQQTLEAMIDWSHDLLTEHEQVMLRRLGVFGGSFTADAVEQVCLFPPLPPKATATLLERLTDSSLVLPPDADSQRYRMLETMRAYARDRLRAAGEVDTTLQQLATYLLDEGLPTEPGTRPTSRYQDWLQWHSDELGNYREAIRLAFERGEPELAGRFALEIHPYLMNAGLVDELEDQLEDAIAFLTDEPTPLRLRLLTLLAGSARNANDPDGKRLIDLIHTDAEALDDAEAIGQALALESELAFWEGNTREGLELLFQAVTALESTRSPALENAVIAGIEMLNRLGRFDEAETLVARLDAERADHALTYRDHYMSDALHGTIAIYRGDFQQAVHLFETCAEHARGLGPVPYGAMLLQKGRAEFGRGNYLAARRLFDEAFTLMPERYTVTAIWSHTIRSLIELEINGPKAAAPHLRNGLSLVAGQDSIIEREAAFTCVAEAALANGKLAEATVLHGAAAAAGSVIPGLVPEYWIQQRRENAVAFLRNGLGPGEFDRHWEEGMGLMFDEAAHFARRVLDEIAPPNPSGVRNPP